MGPRQNSETTIRRGPGRAAQSDSRNGVRYRTCPQPLAHQRTPRPLSSVSNPGVYREPQAQRSLVRSIPLFLIAAVALSDPRNSIKRSEAAFSLELATTAAENTEM